MKFKEYPISFYHATRLKLTPINRLGANAKPVGESVIITFTSIPSRLHVIDLTIRSLLNQSVKPERIVLWLNSDLKGRIPSALEDLVGECFTIKYREGHSSHRKLIYALQEFPESNLVTCDDDLIYPPDWLERLLTSHSKYPSEIVAHECRQVTYDNENSVAPYTRWVGAKPGESTQDTIAIGYGGVLYPSHCLHSDVLNSELYMKLAPRADDLWFKVMAELNGTSVRRSQSPRPKPIPIVGSQKEALGKTNIKQDQNRDQWLALVEHYGLGSK